LAEHTGQKVEKIAKDTNGEYFKSIDSSTLEHIYSELPKKIEREPEDSSIKDWVIISAIVVLLIELYLRFGKFRILP